jgi:hypothetical protein
LILLKIVTHIRINSDEAKASSAESIVLPVRFHGVKIMPKTTGKQLWKTGDIPECECIFLFTDPDDGVHLLGQFCSNGRDNDGKDEWGHTEGKRKFLHIFDKQMGAPDDECQTQQELHRDPDKVFREPEKSPEVKLLYRLIESRVRRDGNLEIE